MKEKRYLHVFAAESNYSRTLLELLDRHVDLDQHDFYFGFGHRDKERSPIQLKLQRRIFHMRNLLSLFRLISSLRNYKWVYFHYLSYDPTLIFWFFQRKRLRMSTWVIWGNDIYSYYRRNNNFRTRLYEYCRRSIIASFPEIAAFVEEDVVFVKEKYNSRAEYIPILYPIPGRLENLKIISEDSFQNDKPVFMLGNSADPSNFHIEMLDAISKYGRGKFRVICPLSYGGNPQYIKEVINKGTECFGSEFVPLLQILNSTDYATILRQVDIVLMNHNRQQGLGNILALMYLGKKVYIRTNISSYYFFKRHDCEIYDINLIGKVPLDEVLSPVLDKQKNITVIESILDEKNSLNLWIQLFNRH